MPKNSKRILSVSIRKMYDDSPDTSWLGQYSDRPESEYAIDRAHTLDCASQAFNPQTAQAKQTLEHAQQTVGDMYNSILAEYNGTLANEKLDTERDALDDAYNELGELIESVSECDCGERGDMERNEYRYFNAPIENYKGETPENIRKYVLQDYNRMESLNRGDWCFIGIRADAEILPNATWENSVVSKASWHKPIAPYQTITSGGLWGIESDSDKAYLSEVEQEQLAELREQLKALGFSARAISKAFKTIEHKEE